MIRPEVIRKRLATLEENLQILRSLRTSPVDAFTTDPLLYGSTERFLQLSIEALNDVAAHVAASLKLGPVEVSRDLPKFFLEHGTIDEDLADRWVRMIGFRNVLVHDYLDIDRTIVHDVLQRHLEDLERLAKAFSVFL